MNSHGKRVYLDAMAATPLDPVVREMVCDAFERFPANAGSLHQEGRAAARALERARSTVASVLGAQPDEVIFTSGGSEANNHALVGVVRALRKEGYRGTLRIVVSALEHASVAEVASELAREEGIEVIVIPVDEEGVISLEALEQALSDDVALVSCVAVSNEVGTLEPIADVVEVVQRWRRRHQSTLPFVHTDAAQAPAACPVNMHHWGVDLMSVDAQKVYGPKGIGALVRRRSVPLVPLVYGGAQEGGLRGGTSNVPLVVGFAEALRRHERMRTERHNHLAQLHTQLHDGIVGRIARVVRNGPPYPRRAVTNLNFSFLGVEGEYTVLALDARGIAVSTRSACHGPGGSGSPAVYAMTGDVERAQSAVRFSFHPWLSEQDIAYTLDVLVEVVAMGRNERTPSPDEKR